MSQPRTLQSAQVHFLEAELAFVHVPLPVYHLFVPVILKLLLSNASTDASVASNVDNIATESFLNISVTPVECSVACSRALADRIFVPAPNELDEDLRKQVSISRENYIVMRVDGEGLGAGERVVELTSPLAMEGIPIFFISTYVSDYILVPQRSHSNVIDALKARGFTFKTDSDAFMNRAPPYHRPSSHHNASKYGPSTSSFPPGNLNPWTSYPPVIAQTSRPPRTPPPSSLDELKKRTFATLKHGNVVPIVNSDIRLVQCSERKASVRDNARMQSSLTECLLSTPHPRFFSMTLAEGEAASFLLEQRLLQYFEDRTGGTVTPLLMGDLEGILGPIILDLTGLSMESTGIVCGVAGMLVSPTPVEDPDLESTLLPENIIDPGLSDMIYLSTAKAAAVVVEEGSLELARNILASATKSL